MPYFHKNMFLGLLLLTTTSLFAAEVTPDSKIATNTKPAPLQTTGEKTDVALLPELSITEYRTREMPALTGDTALSQRFNYQASNTGRAIAHDVTISSGLLDGFIYESHTCQPGWTSNVRRMGSLILATCEGGTLAPRGTVEMDITTRKPRDCSETAAVPLSIQAYVQSSDFEFNYENNITASLIYLVNCP